MNRWVRVNDLFHAARARSSSERAAFLAGECGADTELRAEIESLLAAHDANGASTATSSIRAGTRVGDYEGRRPAVSGEHAHPGCGGNTNHAGRELAGRHC